MHTKVLNINLNLILELRRVLRKTVLTEKQQSDPFLRFGITEKREASTIW